MRFLVDTHVLVRWATEPDRLSREQMRILRTAGLRREPVGISAVALLELAHMLYGPVSRVKHGVEPLFRDLEENPMLRILPLTVEIAREVPGLQTVLRDLADSVIVATARAHGLRLLTSDQRILDSNLVPTIA